jgi:hypothetical protein
MTKNQDFVLHCASKEEKKGAGISRTPRKEEVCIQTSQDPRDQAPTFNDEWTSGREA